MTSLFPILLDFPPNKYFVHLVIPRKSHRLSSFFLLFFFVRLGWFKSFVFGFRNSFFCWFYSVEFLFNWLKLLAPKFGYFCDFYLFGEFFLCILSCFSRFFAFLPVFSCVSLNFLSITILGVFKVSSRFQCDIAYLLGRFFDFAYRWAQKCSLILDFLILIAVNSVYE
jgi:hypothetical protein